MVDWTSPEQLALDAASFIKFMHAMAGLYFWEFAVSLDFDLEFITGKRRFRWPLCFYMLGRYVLLSAMIGILVALDTTHEINCQALYTFNQFMGNAAVGMASINLSIRTMAVWAQSRYIVIPLILILSLHDCYAGVLLKAEWIPGEGCIITDTNNTILAATFIYSMCFDAVVMVLNAVRLAPRTGHSRLLRLLFKDGVIYFIVAFLSNLVATVFMLLNLNSVMSVIFNVPAAVLSTIVASRAVRRLVKFTANGPEMFTPSTHSSALRSARSPITSGNHNAKNLNSGVHIQMQSFTIGDEESGRADDVEAKQQIVGLPLHDD
ncbi:hypothetical protein B0H21DRAFT_839132 [Amylocystis lapponica]|nr:hypothetical protein B0H21DRAFT_839132 [Amylocystis lapponica]